MAFTAGQLGHVTEHNRLLGAPLGTLTGGYVQVVASQPSITTQVDLTGLVTPPLTVGSGRRIRIDAQVLFTSSVAGDYAQLLILEGATTLQIAEVPLPSTSGSTTCHASIPLTPSAGAHTYKLAAFRVVGTGSVTMQAFATIPAFIHVYDVGI